MAGDGNFKWFWAQSEDAESWGGGEDSREAAISAGRNEFGCDSFWICECDKSVMTANFDPDRIAEIVMEDLVDGNEECFGEDHDQDDVWPGDEPFKALSASLNKAVEEWLARYPGKTWCFGDARSVEKIEALTDA